MQRAGVKQMLAATAVTLSVSGLAVSGPAGEARLGAAASAAGRYFDAALDPGDFDERPYHELAVKQLTSVTPENAMKWGVVEPQRGHFDWKGADALVAFAKANGQKIRGHTLVWHLQLPPWLINGGFQPDEVKDLMVAHIMEEASRYKGVIYAWDVVNEPFADDGAWRRSIWYDAMGPAYVAVALKAAHAADPELSFMSTIMTSRPTARRCGRSTILSPRSNARACQLMASACDRISSPERCVDIQFVMEKFAGLGVDVAVTELDLRVRLPAGGKAILEQAADYASVVRACRATPRCVGVTTWGVTDGHSWIPSFSWLWRGAAV